ncbi:MAG: hypothetical protein KAI47_15505, partial [Deltaproteobacteria bacterium]|nr:hypothetical protein [Deltaproteobacteria bacterium]
ASGGDLFGGGGQPQDPQDAGSGGVFAPSSPASSGGDLFGAAGGAGVFSEDAREQMPSYPSIPVQQMTGQRGENSVLFSLANLQALATGGPGAKPSSSASASESSKAGMASGGGSGLIDIKAMAATVSPRASSSPSASDDALPSIGGFGGPIAAAPVLMPTAGDDRPAWLIPTLIGGGVVVLALAVTLVVLIAGKKDTPHQPQVAVNMAGQTARGTAAGKTAGVTETSGTAAKPGAATAGKTAGTTPPAKGASAATPPKASGKSASSSTGRSKRRSRRGKKRHQSGTHRASTPTRMASVAPKTARKKRGTKKKHDELDDLLDGAMGGGKKRRPARRAAPAPKKPAAAPASNLPDKLGRSQIVSGMGRIKGRIKACRDRFRVPGMAMVRVAIGANGRVSSARVSGIFAGTPTGSCVARAVKSARFPKTKRPSTIKYPFVLR